MSSRKTKIAGGRSTTKKINQQNMTSYIIITIALIFIIGPVVAGIISDNAPRNYYVKDIKTAAGTITQLATEDGKYYAKVNINDYLPIISEDNSWVEIDNTFYMSSPINKQVGVLLNESDVYKKKYMGLFGDKGQNFEKSIWTIENIYPTFADATNAYPNKTFNAEAVILKKKITKQGDYFFIVDSDSKRMTVQIDKATFDKYNVNDKVNCEFESIGDFTKLIKVAT